MEHNTLFYPSIRWDRPPQRLAWSLALYAGTPPGGGSSIPKEHQWANPFVSDGLWQSPGPRWWLALAWLKGTIFSQPKDSNMPKGQLGSSSQKTIPQNATQQTIEICIEEEVAQLSSSC